MLEGIPNLKPQHAKIDWFRDVVVSTHAHRLHCRFNRAVGGDYEHQSLRALALNLPNQINS